MQENTVEIVGRSDSEWAGDSATRQSITRFHCTVQGVMMCNRSLKQTVISLSSCEAEFYAASECAAELLGPAELFKELHYTVSVKLEMHSDSARHALERRGPGRLKHIEIRCSARVDMKNNTADIRTKYLDGPRDTITIQNFGTRCGR